MIPSSVAQLCRLIHSTSEYLVITPTHYQPLADIRILSSAYRRFKHNRLASSPPPTTARLRLFKNGSGTLTLRRPRMIPSLIWTASPRKYLAATLLLLGGEFTEHIREKRVSRSVLRAKMKMEARPSEALAYTVLRFPLLRALMRAIRHTPLPHYCFEFCNYCTQLDYSHSFFALGT